MMCVAIDEANILRGQRRTYQGCLARSEPDARNSFVSGDVVNFDASYFWETTYKRIHGNRCLEAGLPTSHPWPSARRSQSLSSSPNSRKFSTAVGSSAGLRSGLLIFSSADATTSFHANRRWRRFRNPVLTGCCEKATWLLSLRNIRVAAVRAAACRDCRNFLMGKDVAKKQRVADVATFCSIRLAGCAAVCFEAETSACGLQTGRCNGGKSRSRLAARDCDVRRGMQAACLPDLGTFAAISCCELRRADLATGNRAGFRRRPSAQHRGFQRESRGNAPTLSTGASGRDWFFTRRGW